MATTSSPTSHAEVGPGPLGPFTPERPKAPWGLRALAVLLDSAVVAGVAFLATGDPPSLAALPGLGDPAEAGGTGWAAATLLALGALQGYTGMTPGKRVVGVSVVDAGSGRPIGLLGTVLRWLAHVLDSILLVGYLRAAWHPEGRTFADSLLGTVAVHTTTPEPHPWVARARRLRDRSAPGLRWPRRATGAAALVLCAGAAAMSLVPGSASETGSADETLCMVTEPVPLTAMITASRTTSWETRLGISRAVQNTWHLDAGWSDEAPGTTDTDGEPGDLPDGLHAVVLVRSPGGTVPRALPDDGAAPGPASSMPGTVLATARTATSEDVTGWTATTQLLGDGGTVLAECSGVIPPIAAARRVP
ncbi:RDD family protein [Isoptericola sp. BMS4]|uniref:RDD family protein n=1 Tax=Isoptericola sp. BMS4 TaxID=2527875 RepID=UPI0014216C4A|nr:RDD family protein [Isoptericola sp. BMS4]